MGLVAAEKPNFEELLNQALTSKNYTLVMEYFLTYEIGYYEFSLLYATVLKELPYSDNKRYVRLHDRIISRINANLERALLRGNEVAMFNSATIHRYLLYSCLFYEYGGYLSKVDMNARIAAIRFARLAELNNARAMRDLGRLFSYSEEYCDQLGAPGYKIVNLFERHEVSLKQAKGYYLKAIELEPSDVNSLAECAVVCRKLGDYQEAIDLLDRAIALGSRDAVYCRAAMFFLGQGSAVSYVEAVRLFCTVDDMQSDVLGNITVSLTWQKKANFLPTRLEPYPLFTKLFKKPYEGPLDPDGRLYNREEWRTYSLTKEQVLSEILSLPPEESEKQESLLLEALTDTPLGEFFMIARLSGEPTIFSGTLQTVFNEFHKRNRVVGDIYYHVMYTLKHFAEGSADRIQLLNSVNDSIESGRLTALQGNALKKLRYESGQSLLELAQQIEQEKQLMVETVIPGAPSVANSGLSLGVYAGVTPQGSLEQQYIPGVPPALDLSGSGYLSLPQRAATSEDNLRASAMELVAAEKPNFEELLNQALTSKDYTLVIRYLITYEIGYYEFSLLYATVQGELPFPYNKTYVRLHDKFITSINENLELALLRGNEVGMFNRATIQRYLLYSCLFCEGDVHLNGVDKNAGIAAARLFDRLAELNNARAMRDLGRLFSYSEKIIVQSEARGYRIVNLFERHEVSLKQAKGYYLKAIELEPSDVNSLAECAVVCRKLGDYQEAIDLFDRAIALGSRDAVYCRAAMYLLGQGSAVSYVEAARLFCSVDDMQSSVTGNITLSLTWQKKENFLPTRLGERAPSLFGGAYKGPLDPDGRLYNREEWRTYSLTKEQVLSEILSLPPEESEKQESLLLEALTDKPLGALFKIARLSGEPTIFSGTLKTVFNEFHKRNRVVGDIYYHIMYTLKHFAEGSADRIQLLKYVNDSIESGILTDLQGNALKKLRYERGQSLFELEQQIEREQQPMVEAVTPGALAVASSELNLGIYAGVTPQGPSEQEYIPEVPPALDLSGSGYLSLPQRAASSSAAAEEQQAADTQQQQRIFSESASIPAQVNTVSASVAPAPTRAATVITRPPLLEVSIFSFPPVPTHEPSVSAPMQQSGSAQSASAEKELEGPM